MSFAQQMNQPKLVVDPASIYQGGEAVLRNTRGREVLNELPTGQRKGLKAGEVIEFEVSNDQFLDLSTAVFYYKPGLYNSLGAKVTPATNSTDSIAHEAHIANAADIVHGHLTEYNHVKIQEASRNANTWSNQFLSMTANDSWTEREGTVSLGYNHPTLGKKDTENNRITQDRWFAVPLSLISGLYRIKSYLPLVGGMIRITITLASDLQFLSHRIDTGDTYQIEDCYLEVDRVDMNDDYRNLIFERMRGAGLQIPFLDYATEIHPADNSEHQQITLRKKYLNALALFVLRNNRSVKTATANTHTAYCQSFPIADKGLHSFVVKSGSLDFTPQGGIKNMTAMYMATEKAVNSIADLSGTGIINFDTLNGLYVKNADFSDPAADYGSALLGCSLEKTIASADNLANNGLTTGTGGAASEISIDLETNNALVNSEDDLLTCVVHKCALVLAADKVQVIR